MREEGGVGLVFVAGRGFFGLGGGLCGIRGCGLGLLLLGRGWSLLLLWSLCGVEVGA